MVNDRLLYNWLTYPARRLIIRLAWQLIRALGLVR